MTRRRLVLALLVAATPAGAVWGPTVGGQVFQPKHAGDARLAGWEVGLAAFGPKGEGFWHFAYGQVRNPKKTATLTTMAGRLNIRIMRNQDLMVYVGPGFDRDTLKTTVTKSAWVGRGQAGVLLCAARMSAADKAATPDAPPPGPEASKSLDFGLEGGYRFGPTAFSGFDARVYLLLTF